MTDTQPAVDVVILTWNDGDLLDVAVASVHGSTQVAARSIVVDNGSEPPAAPVARPGDLLVRNEANLGVAPARNQGVACGDAPFVCLLDSDARLHPDTLAVLIDALVADDRIGLVAPVFDGQSPTASGGVAPTLGRKVRRLLGSTDEYAGAVAGDAGTWDVDFAIGACQLFRREAFDQVGGLDTSYFYGPEDADFCMRLRVAGWRVLQVADAHCEHPPRRRNRKVLTRRGVQHGWAVARFLWRHRSYRRHVPVP